MKAAFIIDIGDGSELEKLKEALSLMGYPAEVVSSFGINLGRDVNEEEVSVPHPAPRRGRKAELQEAEFAVRGMQTIFQNPDTRAYGQSFTGGTPILEVSIELAAPYDDQKVISLLQRIQVTGMVALRNVER